MSEYIPDRGDLIYLEFDPQAGKEQKGHRPALVLSPIEYNSKSGLAIVCPITSKEKGYPFEVKITNTLKINGVVLSDHIRSIDWRARKALFQEKCTKTTLQRVISFIDALLKQ